MTRPAAAGSAPLAGEVPLVELIAAAVRAVPGVAELHGGRFGEVATYLPGRRVAGVRLLDGAAEIHLSVRYGRSVAEVAAAVRRAVRTLMPGTVDVVVEDVVVEDVVVEDCVVEDCVVEDVAEDVADGDAVTDAGPTTGSRP